MPHSAHHDRVGMLAEASTNCMPPPRSSGTLCDLQEATKKKSFVSAIVRPLVVLSLLQVATNLVLHHNHTLQRDPISYPSNNQLLQTSVCQDNRICKLTEVTDENSFYSSHKIINANSHATMHDCDISNLDHQANSCSSQRSPISSLESSSPSSLLTYLPAYVGKVSNKLHAILSQTTSVGTIFGPKILLADAAQISGTSMYHANHDKEIIVLNSTNFNAELIQYKNAFPHIKLVEYYLAYSGICLRFKPTYVELAKQIYPWRNVIRASAIDLSISINTLIASSWSIDVIPTLRVHPPPSSALSSRLNKHLLTLDTKSSQSDQLKSMSDQYNAANLTIGSLGVTKYMYDAKKENLAEKVSSLKLDLIRYIERYVNEHPEDLPSTWPNLRPVTEETLIDLRRNHPRQELFLIVEAGGHVDSSGAPTTDPSSTRQPSLGLQIMMELSSSAAHKAVRYVQARENGALIKDVILHKRKESAEQTTDGQHNNNGNVVSDEQVDLLQALLDNKSTDQQDNVVLIHIDDSRSPYGQSASAPTNKFPSISVITGSDLVTVEQQSAGSDSAGSGNSARAKRAVVDHSNSLRMRRSSDDANKMSLQRKLDSVMQYINHTYVEVQEDREFLQALSSFDENPTSHNLKREAVEKFRATQQENEISLSHNIRKSKQREIEKESNNSTLNQLLNRLNPTSSNSFLSSATQSHRSGYEDDYEDKLKAIRYIFLQEVPRKTLADKTPTEKIERLNTLINLAAVIKAYFPLPDLASVQFIDGIHSYLTKQQALIALSLNDQPDRVAGQSGASFDLRALKQVIKNLEAEGKRLPRLKDWQHCKFSGYPCAVWRLFHTLTAFEYKKLIQISQQSHSTSRQVSAKQQNSSVQLSAETQTLPSEEQKANSPTSSALESANGSPVERLVSPPSTTTSLSLTIATPHTAQDHQHAPGDNQNNNRKQVSEADLPEPVLLVMRDYVTNFFSCEECSRNFRQEAMDLTFERIRRQEPAEFSIMWLWETHNRVSKRLSVSNDTNPPEHPKKWFPSFDQCPKCYKKPPSFLKETNLELAAIFHESIDWNREEILSFLVDEFTRQPMDMGTNLFGYPVPYGFNYIVVIGISSLILIILLRCASCYIERQRRHKAGLLNGNGAQYSVELQSR